MKEEIGLILEQLKLKNLSVSKIEKALEYSNGTLGKARDGKINLPIEKMDKLRAYAKVHLEIPRLDGKVIPLKKTITDPWPPDLLEKIHADKSQRDWLTKDALKIYEWCEKKGFPPSELIEKFEELEAFYDKFKNINMGQTQSEIHLQDMTIPHLNQNKPNTALQTENAWIPTAIVGKAKEWSGNSAGKGVIDETGGFFNAANVLRQQEIAKKPPKPESKPKELSPFLKSRQNLKNGIK